MEEDNSLWVVVMELGVADKDLVGQWVLPTSARVVWEGWTKRSW